MSTEKPEHPEHPEPHHHHPLLEMFNADGVIEHPADPQPEGPEDTPLGDQYAP
jgi:hypothetical protein